MTDKVLYYWQPSKEERERELSRYGNMAEEYKAVHRSDAPGDIVLYGKYHGEWVANAGERCFISHLLKKLHILRLENL